MELGQPGLGGLASPPGLREPVAQSGPLGQEVPMVGLPPLLCSLTCSKLAQVLLCRATVDSPEGGMHPGNGPKPQGPGIRAGL